MDKKKFGRTVLFAELAVIVIIVVAICFSSFYTVNEQERAVITQFGKSYDETGAGLHFKIPFIQQVYKVDMTTRGLELGYKSQGEHGEYSISVESESFMITNDFNFVTIDFYVEWKVSNATKYWFNSENPEMLLRNILQSEARSIVSSYSVDDVLTTAKTEIQAKMKESVINTLDSYDLGIMVLNISIQDAQPPTDTVVSAFKNVENAKQNKATDINIATAYVNEIIPGARAEADKIKKDAEADKEARINEAKGQVARFNEMYSEYILNNRDITKLRIYLETLEQVLPDMKVYIQDSGSSEPLKVLDITGGTDNAVNMTNGGEAYE